MVYLRIVVRIVKESIGNHSVNVVMLMFSVFSEHNTKIPSVVGYRFQYFLLKDVIPTFGRVFGSAKGLYSSQRRNLIVPFVSLNGFPDLHIRTHSLLKILG
jgi:hypothetical protein